jgi:hypothetical protein
MTQDQIKMARFSTQEGAEDFTACLDRELDARDERWWDEQERIRRGVQCISPDLP